MKLQTLQLQEGESKRKGRTLLAGGRTRDKHIQLRLSEEEHAILAGQARSEGKTFTAYLIDQLVPQTTVSLEDLVIRVNGKPYIVSKEMAKSIVNQILNQLTQ